MDPTRASTPEEPPGNGGGAAGQRGGFEPWHQHAWRILNSTTAPIWLAMIVFPRSKVTAMLVRRIDLVLGALGVTYVGLLATGVANSDAGPPDLVDPSSVAAGLGRPEAFLGAWTHDLALDLLAGRWVWEQSLAAGRTARLPLLLTWWFGPAGVTLHLVRRRRWK
jgi:hypothetical protein